MSRRRLDGCRLPRTAVRDGPATVSPYTASTSLANLSHRAIISPRYCVSLGVVVSARSLVTAGGVCSARGTEGSKPASSTAESVANLTPKHANIEKAAQFARVVRVLKLAERLGLDLPDSFAGRGWHISWRSQ